jgi:hypothetical protein
MVGAFHIETPGLNTLPNNFIGLPERAEDHTPYSSHFLRRKMALNKVQMPPTCSSINKGRHPSIWSQHLVLSMVQLRALGMGRGRGRGGSKASPYILTCSPFPTLHPTQFFRICSAPKMLHYAKEGRRPDCASIKVPRG